MQNEKTIEALNTLITINNDRIEGYQTAANETEDQEFKTLFTKLIETSIKCKNELAIEVEKLGGTPSEDTKIIGKFFRVWMDVKAALTGKNNKAILDSCEYGEDVANTTYENVMHNHADDLTTELQSIIRTQHAVLKSDHDRVKSMRDMLILVKE